MKTTTLREIIKHDPCIGGLIDLLEGLGYPTEKELLTEEQLNAKLPTRFIFENNDAADTIWALRVFAGTPDWYRFKADVAELVLPIYEEIFPLDKRLRLAIEAARNYADGEINKEELKAELDILSKYPNVAGTTVTLDRVCSEVTKVVHMVTCDCENNASRIVTCVYIAHIYAARARITDTDIPNKTTRINILHTWEEIIKILLKYI